MYGALASLHESLSLKSPEHIFSIPPQEIGRRMQALLLDPDTGGLTEFAGGLCLHYHDLFKFPTPDRFVTALLHSLSLTLLLDRSILFTPFTSTTY